MRAPTTVGWQRLEADHDVTHSMPRREPTAPLRSTSVLMRASFPANMAIVNLPGTFRLYRGGVLQQIDMAYETVGLLNAARDNVILVMPGLSPNAHLASHVDDPSSGWWEDMVGPEKPIDTRHWHVVCINSLGSCKGSTGPASVDPRTGEPYRLDFPELSIEDIADAAAAAVNALGIKRIACVIGASMGGMSALSLIARHPHLTRNLINISSAIHSLPFAIAIRAMQREAIQSDPNWNAGRYDEIIYPEQGMCMARKLGVITYRSAREWDVRFGRLASALPPSDVSLPFHTGFAVESYLDCQAQRFARSFDPNSYLYLSRSMDWFDLRTSHGHSAQDALAGLMLKKALVLGVTTDILFPIQQQQEIAHGLQAGGTQVTFVPLDIVTGHDAFLVEIDSFGPPVAAFLSTLLSCKSNRLDAHLVSTS